MSAMTAKTSETSGKIAKIRVAMRCLQADASICVWREAADLDREPTITIHY